MFFGQDMSFFSNSYIIQDKFTQNTSCQGTENYILIMKWDCNIHQIQPNNVWFPHLLKSRNIPTCDIGFHVFKAGLTFNEVAFNEWVYEEELEYLNMEHVTLGKLSIKAQFKKCGIIFIFKLLSFWHVGCLSPPSHLVQSVSTTK